MVANVFRIFCRTVAETSPHAVCVFRGSPPPPPVWLYARTHRRVGDVPRRSRVPLTRWLRSARALRRKKRCCWRSCSSSRMRWGPCWAQGGAGVDGWGMAGWVVVPGSCVGSFVPTAATNRYRTRPYPHATQCTDGACFVLVYLFVLPFHALPILFYILACIHAYRHMDIGIP
jgi:hypothetical protein